MAAPGALKPVIMNPSSCIRKVGWPSFVFSVTVKPNVLNGVPRRL
jgi:hypothetical protein